MIAYPGIIGIHNKRYYQSLLLLTNIFKSEPGERPQSILRRLKHIWSNRIYFSLIFLQAAIKHLNYFPQNLIKIKKKIQCWRQKYLFSQKLSRMICCCKVWFQHSSQPLQKPHHLGSFGGSGEIPYSVEPWMEFKFKVFMSCSRLCQCLVLLHKTNPNTDINLSALHKQCQSTGPYTDAVADARC